MPTRFFKILSNGNKILKSKLVTAPSYKIFNFSFPFSIGDEVAIPLLLADEKEAIVDSLVQKANHIASLKADLVGDLAGLVRDLNNSPK